MEDATGRPGASATEIAAAVRAGRTTARAVVQAHLDRIVSVDPVLNAFRVVRRDRALDEADAVDRRRDKADLPLAGVPVAIKDNVEVAGELTGHGSRAAALPPAERDHEVVRRLRAAGAVVVGITRMPELGLWATTDEPGLVTRNPWEPTRTPGGSSGGAAAAVAAGLVPLAHGNDGLGSLRIPAACCGLVTLKPGSGVVPGGFGVDVWDRMAAHGVLATTVDDVVVAHDVLSGRRLRPEVLGPLRVAVSLRSPVAGVWPDRAARAAVDTARDLLLADAHLPVDVAGRLGPPYTLRTSAGLLLRWTAGAKPREAGEPAVPRKPRSLQARTRGHARVGRAVRNLGLLRTADRWANIGPALDFFRHWDILLTPVLAGPPPPADVWSERSWLANLMVNTRYAPYAAVWNLLGFPAVAVPVGVDEESRLPTAVQLVGPPGSEGRLLAVAAQMHARRPWRRHAPAFDPVSRSADGRAGGPGDQAAQTVVPTT